MRYLCVVVGFRPPRDYDTCFSNPWTNAWHVAFSKTFEGESQSHSNSEQFKQLEDWRKSQLQVSLSSSQMHIWTQWLQLGNELIISIARRRSLDKEEHVLPIQMGMFSSNRFQDKQFRLGQLFKCNKTL